MKYISKKNAESNDNKEDAIDKELIDDRVQNDSQKAKEPAHF